MEIDVIKAVDRSPRGRSKRTPVLVLGAAMLALFATIGWMVTVAMQDGRPQSASWTDGARASRQTATVSYRIVTAWTAADPRELRRVSAVDAKRLNDELPISAGRNPAASAMALPLANGQNLAAGLECLTTAIYYEAAAEPEDGQRAVAQVILNRVRHPAYPRSICGVVYQGVGQRTACQFTFACDGSLARAPIPALWKRARAVAAAAIGGFVYAPVGWATHYHADYVFPNWAPTLVKASVIGRHIFYRMPGGMGSGAAFDGRRYLADESGELRLAQVREAGALAQLAAAQPGLTEAGAAAPSQARAVLLPDSDPAAKGGAAPPVPVARAPDRYVLGQDGGSLH